MRVLYAAPTSGPLPIWIWLPLLVVGVPVLLYLSNLRRKRR
jgi:hypothetical protein